MKNFFLFQLKMQVLRKIERENSKGISQKYDLEKVHEFIDFFPISVNKCSKTSRQ